MRLFRAQITVFTTFEDRIFDTFDERQQEFLVEGELDFSKLKDVKICCYDEYQADMLKQELKGTKWADIVSCGTGLYERSNKEIYFRDRNDTISKAARHPMLISLSSSNIGITR